MNKQCYVVIFNGHSQVIGKTKPIRTAGSTLVNKGKNYPYNSVKRGWVKKEDVK